jgi:hypothetical protein
MRWILALVLSTLLGCAAHEAPGRVASAEIGAPTLVAIGEPSEAPPGSDAVPHRAVAFRMPDGSTRPVDREAVAFVSRWGTGAALVDPERRLYEVRPDGARRMLVAGASGSLAVSPDGTLLVYVVARDVLGELRVHDGAQERTLAAGLASIGVLRVEGERVFFVGARSGGVVGVWTAALDGSGARCLTNCDLVTGTDFAARFVPPPSSPDAFERDGDVLAWRDPDGVRHEARLEAP